jgi:hypothetical protein
VRVRFTTPARAAPEWAKVGAPRSNACGWTIVTIDPYPVSIMRGTARLITFQVPFRFRSTTARQPPSLIWLGRGRELAAGVADEEVQRAEGVPGGVDERLDRRHVPDVVTLARHRRPIDSMSRRVRSRPSASRAAITTSAPCGRSRVPSHDRCRGRRR